MNGSVVSGSGSPVAKLRQERGLTRREMAQVLGVADGLLARAELGYNPRLQPIIRRRFHELGIDVTALCAEYESWYQKQREQSTRAFKKSAA